ncbi:hypothetical protein [Kitasatospora sp. NPDC057015]|uniref:hypothetical protein n=1 Tax=Kitasatospora sp. NPDC057015 TaxID=3346001 RepID=UPI00363FD022
MCRLIDHLIAVPSLSSTRRSMVDHAGSEQAARSGWSPCRLVPAAVHHVRCEAALDR